jgi:hypothetical protein
MIRMVKSFVAKEQAPPSPEKRENQAQKTPLPRFSRAQDVRSASGFHSVLHPPLSESASMSSISTFEATMSSNVLSSELHERSHSVQSPGSARSLSFLNLHPPGANHIGIYSLMF